MDSETRSKYINNTNIEVQLLWDKINNLTEIEKNIKSSHSKLTDYVNGEKQKATDEYENFKKLVFSNTKNVKKLFDLASTESIANIYTTRSLQEKEEANTFRNIAFALMGTVFLIDALFIFNGLLIGFKGFEALSVVTLSLMLLTPAIYLSKESNKHRKFEQENIKISQNIGAILSFISNMTEEERTKVTHSIAQSLLDNMTPTAQDDSSPSIQFNITEKIFDKLKPNS